MFSFAAIKLAFTTWKGFFKILPYLIVLGLLIFAGWKTFNWIDTRGYDRAKAQWDKETADYAKAIDNLKAGFVIKEQDHIRASVRISDQLAQEKIAHEEDVAAIAADYTERLRVATTRAEIYQRQAQGGPASCTSLASYTTELDNLLEQGRSLAKEGRDLVKLRDRQLTLVGEQLLADRKLFADEEPGK